MLVAVGTFNFFTRYAGDETRIKWPNDIYWRDRKAAGILLENSFRGSNWQWSIAGMGVNINQTKFDVVEVHPVSLKQITGQTFLISALARELCSCLEAALDIYANQGPSAITTLYNTALYKKGERVILEIAEQNITAIICGVLPNGFLEIELENGTKEAHALGSVKWLLKN
jgi:BirA family biotin operon repressor/biotin-[acetyl-CoA-carboxylase] ligase